MTILFSIIAPVFALIVMGTAAVRLRLLPMTHQKYSSFRRRPESTLGARSLPPFSLPQ
jgi:hypothetical protein